MKTITQDIKTFTDEIIKTQSEIKKVEEELALWNDERQKIKEMLKEMNPKNKDDLSNSNILDASEQDRFKSQLEPIRSRSELSLKDRMVGEAGTRSFLE
jgi:hypothetical protein